MWWGAGGRSSARPCGAGDCESRRARAVQALGAQGAQRCWAAPPAEGSSPTSEAPNPCRWSPSPSPRAGGGWNRGPCRRTRPDLWPSGPRAALGRGAACRGSRPWSGTAWKSPREPYLSAGRRPERAPGPRAGPAASGRHPWSGGVPGAASEEGSASAGAFCSPSAGTSPSGYTWEGGQGPWFPHPSKYWALASGWRVAEGGQRWVCLPGGTWLLRVPQSWPSCVLLPPSLDLPGHTSVPPDP